MHDPHVSKKVMNAMQHCTQSTEEPGWNNYIGDYTPGMEYIKLLPSSDQQINLGSVTQPQQLKSYPTALLHSSSLESSQRQPVM